MILDIRLGWDINRHFIVRFIIFLIVCFITTFSKAHLMRYLVGSHRYLDIGDPYVFHVKCNWVIGIALIVGICKPHHIREYTYDIPEVKVIINILTFNFIGRGIANVACAIVG